MKIVVTGSSGLLGLATVRELIAGGHQVVPIDRRPRDGEEPAPTRLADLTRFDELPPLFAGAEVVCHLGNRPALPPRLADQAEGFANNVSATFNVFAAATEAGVRRVVYASSVQAYGIFSNHRDGPRSLPQYLPLDEEHPLLPSDGYPLSKASGEWIAEGFCRRDPGMRAVSLRLTWIHDLEKRPQREATRPQPPPPGRLAVVLAGGSLCTWIHPRDAARAVRLACEADLPPGHTPLNIVSPHAAWRWTPEMIADVWGEMPPLRRELAGNQALIDWRRAEQVLGFLASFKTAEMVSAGGGAA